MKKKLCIYFLLTFTFIVITNIGYKIVLGLELHDKNNIDSYIYKVREFSRKEYEDLKTSEYILELEMELAGA